MVPHNRSYLILVKELTSRIHYTDVISKDNRQVGFILKPGHLSAVTKLPGLKQFNEKFIRYALRYLPWRYPSNFPSYERSLSPSQYCDAGTPARCQTSSCGSSSLASRTSSTRHVKASADKKLLVYGYWFDKYFGHFDFEYFQERFQQRLLVILQIDFQ